MHKIMKRTAVAVAGTAAAVCAATTLATSSASADPGDPDTGGTTTIAVPQKSLLSGSQAGFVVLANSPGTESLDSTGSNVDFAFPVSGGNGSWNADYGQIKNGGGLTVYNTKNGKSATFNSLVIDVPSLTVTTVPSTGGKAFKLFDVTGSNTTSNDPSTGRQEFSSTEVKLDSSGAGYLDRTLGTTVFKCGQRVGTFDSVVYNTQY